MSNDPVDGGTVTPEMVERFKAAWHKADGEGREGERVRDGLMAAMGLTVPEPAPLVVECNGRHCEIDRPDAQAWVDYWERQPIDGQFRRVGQAVAGLLWHALRDARQDPQPANDEGLEVLVRRPAPLSPGECLRDLLAGRDDADRMLRGAAESWYGGVTGPRPIWWSTLRGVIGDAAREVHG